MGWRKLVHLLEMARIEMLLAAVSNIWLMTFLAYAVEPPTRRNPALGGLSQPLALFLATGVAAGLVGCGMALNDVVDARHDRQFAPNRPIPSGRVHITVVVAAAMLSLLAALAAAAFFGTPSTWVALIAAAGILFYILAGRFMPAVGVVSLGLITALSMMVSNPRPAFAWPVVVTMTHVMACAALRHWLAGKRPRFTARDGWGLCAGWAFWSLLLVSQMRGEFRMGQLPALWIGPIAMMFLFVAISIGLLAGKMGPERHRRVAGRRFARWSVLWLILYDTSWLISAGLFWQGAVTLALFVAAWGLNPLVGLTSTVNVRPTFRVTP